MKKILITIFILFLCFIISSSKNITSETVMGISNNNNNCYELIFDEELLSFRNFKLKLATFTSYEYNITKVYIDYPDSIKEKLNDKKYFSFNNSSFNIGIEDLKMEYTNLLKDNYLYSEIEKDINDTQIKKIEIYTEPDAIKLFKSKYPFVKIQILDGY